MLKVKRARAQDILTIKEIEIECGLSYWSENDYLLELNRRDSFFMIAELDKKTVGFINARLLIIENPMARESEIEIYNIAVRKEHRNKSIGSVLLKRLFDFGAAVSADKIHLEVRRSNIEARKFYERHLFRTIGERKNFYVNPADDATLMCRHPVFI